MRIQSQFKVDYSLESSVIEFGLVQFDLIQFSQILDLVVRKIYWVVVSR